MACGRRALTSMQTSRQSDVQPALTSPNGARRARRGGSLLVPLSRSSREAIRTNLWALPSFMVVLVVGLFVVTYQFDVAAAAGRFALPLWVSSGGPDVARQILIAIAAAVITVAGVVFSITILVLQLASQQFGPRPRMQLHPRSRHAGQPGRLCRDVRLLGARSPVSARPSAQLRTAPVDERGSWPRIGRSGRADLLHRP